MFAFPPLSPRTLPVRIFIASFISGIMILNNIYRGELTTKLSLTLVPRPIGKTGQLLCDIGRVVHTD